MYEIYGYWTVLYDDWYDTIQIISNQCLMCLIAKHKIYFNGTHNRTSTFTHLFAFCWPLRAFQFQMSMQWGQKNWNTTVRTGDICHRLNSRKCTSYTSLIIISALIIGATHNYRNTSWRLHANHLHKMCGSIWIKHHTKLMLYLVAAVQFLGLELSPSVDSLANTYAAQFLSER